MLGGLFWVVFLAGGFLSIAEDVGNGGLCVGGSFALRFFFWDVR